jgi:flagellin
MESLEAGEKYRIGGIQYTIGATTNEEAAKALHLENAYNPKTGEWSIDAGDTISIDGKTYTINPDTVGTDVANAKVTNAYLNKLITEGSVIKYNGNEVQRFSTSYNAKTGIDDANVTLIKATAAYQMVATELKAASSVGATDGAAAVVDMDKSDENGVGSVWEKAVISKTIGGDKEPTRVTSISFTLTKGYVNIQNALTLNLHVGADAAMTNKINVTLEAMNAKSIGINGLNVSDATGKAATYAIDAIADAIQRVSAQRAELGAIQNRLEHSIRNLDNVVENTEAAESRIRDTDMADTMVEYSKNNILQQAGQSMLAQANQATQGVMNLLQ